MTTPSTSSAETTGGLRYLAPETDRPTCAAPWQRTVSFSVCLPAYQVEPWIGAAVASAINQTYPAHEIIVCDDGSTDRLDAALAPYEDHVTLLRQPNQGAAAARNTASSAASGDFVVFLDPDDRFVPCRLERLRELAGIRPDLDILTTDAFIEFEDRVIGRYYTEENRFVVDDQRQGILGANFLFGLLAVRRSALAAIGGFDESLPDVYDWDCWLRLILAGARAGMVDEPLAVYTLRPGSSSSSRLRLLRGRQNVLAKACARHGLSGVEHGVARDALVRVQQALALEEVKELLVLRGPDRRRRAWTAATRAEASLTSRFRALGAVLSPALARRLLIRQRHRAEGNPAAVLAARQ